MSLFPDSRLSRRGVTGLAGLAATSAAVPFLDITSAPPASALLQPRDRDGRYRLRRDAGSPVAALDLPVAALPGLTRSRGGTRTPVIQTSEFSLCGVTWRSGGGAVRARFRSVGGGWSAWRTLPTLHDLPDLDSVDAARMPQATELTWVGRSDAVQLELAGDPQAPVLALIEPGRRDEDTVELAEVQPRDAALERSARSVVAVPRPPMRTRKQWGANPDWVSGRVTKDPQLRCVHIHHTVNSNGYGRGDVAGLIRAMQRYHTRNLGWSDIGYNFLVDRFGRIWVGRRGGIYPIVRGAHTLGFNHNSMGVSVIGNFESARPNDAICAAIRDLAAWKLARFGRNPLGEIAMISTGSDRFPRGRKVRLPVIDGHRDTNQTACPGRYLYAQLPRIRRATARRINRFR
jgi:hypothetical protein